MKKLLGIGFSFGFALVHSVQPCWSGEINPPATESQALIGTGYASDKQSFQGNCLGGETVESGINQSNISFSQAISEAQLASELGFEAAGRARFGVISASAAAKFQSAAQSDEFSISANYSGDYQFKNIILKEPKLTEIGARMRGPSNDERWISACGDEYVDQIRLGAKIFFSIRIDFASKADKKAFEANFSIEGPLFGVSGSIKNAMNSFSKRTQVTVSALQIGGNVEQLSQIFGNTETFVKCSLGAFDQCSSVLSAALTYATQVFPKQLSDSQLDPSKPGGPAVMKYITKPYADAGIFLLNAPQVGTEVKQARRTLDRDLTVFYKNSTLVDRYLSSPTRRLSERQTQVLKSIQAHLQDDKMRILDLAQECYDSPSLQCVKDVTALDPSYPEGLYSISPKDLVIDNESFAQFCDEGLSPQGSESIRGTVNACVELAKKKNPELFRPMETGQVIDSCFVSSQILAHQKELNLTDSGVQDLRPLLEFTQFEKIILDGNNIVDVGPLSSPLFGGFHHLKFLSLARNQVESVEGLENIPSLEIIILSGNRIRNASTLSSLQKLHRLDLRNNGPEVRCPNSSIPSCLTSDFGNSGQFVLSERRTGSYRYGLTANLMENNGEKTALILGGIFDAAHKYAELFHYNTGEYSVLNPGIKGRRFHTATSLQDGRILILGGAGRPDGEIYLPRTGQFLNLSNEMSLSKAGHTATLLKDGRVLITGGWRESTLQIPSQSVEIFDPKTLGFSELSTGLSVARAMHTATLLNDGRVLITGGYTDQGSVGTADLFDPVRNEVSSLFTSRMSEPRGAHQATLLQNGTVLITGGLDGTRSLSSADIFDPLTNLFRPTRLLMNLNRGGHQATLLSNGLVLVTGGHSQIEEDFSGMSCSTCIKEAELFDPVTEDFTFLNRPMIYPRAYHSAIQLEPGIVLIVGGLGEKAGSSAEIFTYGGN